MNGQKKVVVISASPKPEGQAASDFLAGIALETLRDETTDVRVINARQALARHAEQEAFRAMAEANALIVVFPLYVFCLPGITMRFLQSYAAYAAKQETRRETAVYAVINCGFPEPGINEEAARVIARFAAAVGARYGFSILIGGGGMVTMSLRPVKKTVLRYRDTLGRIGVEIAAGETGSHVSVSLRVAFPRKLYFLMGNAGWRVMIRRNGKKPGDLYARPYLPAWKV